MKKNRLLFSIIVLGGAFLLYKNIQAKHKIKEQNASISTLRKNAAFTKNILLQQIALSTSDKKIIDIGHLLETNTIRSKNYRNLLTYRYSPNMCSSCLDKDLSILQKYSEKIKTDRILILPAFNTDKDSRIRMQSSLRNFHYINISEEVLPLPIDKDSIAWRYFALLDTNYQISHIFFPCSDFPEATEFYIENLLNSKDLGS